MFGRGKHSTGPTVEPLNASEVTWRGTQVQIAEAIAQRYTGDSEGLPSLERLDACVADWLADDGTRVDVNVLVNAVGVAFGEHVARDTGLEWVIATDRYGTDMALHGQPGDVLLHPKTVVAKRVAAGESSFIVPLHQALVAQVSQVRA